MTPAHPLACALILIAAFYSTVQLAAEQSNTAAAGVLIIAFLICLSIMGKKQ